VLNVGQSWLSREITFFTLFVVTASAYLVWTPGERATGWGTLVVGVAALLSIDMVYKFALRPSLTHSASALLTGAFLAGVLMANPLVAGVAGIVKIGLYARRKIGFAYRPSAASECVASRLRLCRTGRAVGSCSRWDTRVPGSGCIVRRTDRPV
jgi:hypothetical protein